MAHTSQCINHIHRLHLNLLVFVFFLKMHLVLFEQTMMLMKVLIHPGHGKSKCCIVNKWTCLSFLKMFHLSCKRHLQFQLSGGELHVFKLCVGVS